MLEILGIVLFALAIAGSIAWHELGHLWPAKRFGVKVTEYMIGFGPTMWAVRKGETSYGFKAIPLGGYIRMIGMIPPGPTGEQRSMTTGRFATMIAEARQQANQDIGPEDAGRLFYQLPVRKRLVIMLGGPVMNLILAFFLFAIVLVGIGLPQPTLQVDAVVPCTPIAQQASTSPLPSGACPDGSAQTPAAEAGLQPGDVIRSIDGRPVADWAEVSAWIRASAGKQATLSVERDGGVVQIPVNVAQIDRPVVDEQGEATGEVAPAGFVGIRPAFDYVPEPWTSVPAYMWDLTARSAMALVSLPVRLYELVSQTLIGGGERQIDSPVSVVGASRLGGEIVAMDEPIEGKIATFIGLVASLNLFLFLFNLLPVLPLDGGHVAGALYEGARRQVAKVRRRPDPGPVDVAKLMPVAYIVAAVLIAMGVIVIWADIVKPISLG